MGGAAASDAVKADAPPAAHFARLPFIKQVRVAPGGKYFSAKVSYENRYVASVFRFTDGGGIESVFTLKEDDERWVRVLDWANPDRLIISIGFNANRYGADTVESRLFALTPGEEKPDPLFRYDKYEAPQQFEDEIVSWLRRDPDHILLSYRKDQSKRSPGVYKARVDAQRRHGMVQTPVRGVLGWQADVNGAIRSGFGFRGRNESEARLIVRSGSDEKWRDISHRVRENAPYFVIRGFSEDPNIAYVVSGHEFDPPALYAYEIAADSIGRMLFRSETSEIAGILLDPESGVLRGVAYGREGENVEWLDPALKSEIRGLERQFPDRSISLVGESGDGAFSVYDVSGVTAPPTYYVYDRKVRRLIELPPSYPELASYSLSPVESVDYSARDGLSIPAYVTLPNGAATLGDTRNAPFVILPHGGPAARDYRRFDYWAQFLASRGYGVLQMNFRGSTGYGAEFRQAGDREWGQAMQDDITDGVKWLIERGFADPNRIAILGGSYGGYAALMGAAKTPDLYQCAISFAGVSDLQDLLSRADDYIGGRAGTRHIGNLWKDRKMLRANSPARLAENVQAPVLLIHGEDDRVVDVKQSREMRRELRRADKDVTYIELPKGDHYLSLYGNRLRFLQETETFLAGCIG